MEIMEANKLYQICAYGNYKLFEKGTGKIFSSTVYREIPNEEEINIFIQKCCFSEDGIDDLEISSVRTKIFELVVK